VLVVEVNTFILFFAGFPCILNLFVTLSHLRSFHNRQKDEEGKALVSLPSDHHLMLQVRSGDVGKLGILFERYHGMLFNFFLRMTGSNHVSEDLVQDVFFRILKYRNTYRDKSQFTTWMYKIARHVRFDDLKKRKPEILLEEQEQLWASRDPIPIDSLEKKQEMKILGSALLQLPPEKREVLILSRFQHLKYEEIASIIGCDVGTVKVRVYRATRELRDIFFNLSGEKAS
jgi:RNA polymerase sigma-70 factor (ECF subfamily)